MGASMLLRRVLLSRAGVALMAASAVGIGASAVVVRTELAPFTPGVQSVVLPRHAPPRAIVGPEISPPAPVRLAGRGSPARPAVDLALSLQPTLRAVVAPTITAVAAVAKPVVSAGATPVATKAGS